MLLVAAGLALLLGEVSDAGFIAAVLLLNAAIGFVNEVRADREVQALTQLVRSRARVHRGARVVDVDGEDVVPGDLLVLESGSRVSADMRLVEAHGLRIDESLLTGESVPADKDEAIEVAEKTPLADRHNMAFAGSMVASGRGLGVVVATATRTEVGAIAGALAAIPREPPPLIRRMERFARVVGMAVVTLAGVLVVIGGAARSAPRRAHARSRRARRVLDSGGIARRAHRGPRRRGRSHGTTRRRGSRPAGRRGARELRRDRHRQDGDPHPQRAHGRAGDRRGARVPGHGRGLRTRRLGSAR